MLLSSTKKTRGRPREFDKDAALEKASEVFRLHGYAGTSIDRLAEAMGIFKPSLYGTYGGKAQLYLLTLEAFASRIGSMAEDALAREEPLRAAIRRYLGGVLSIYYEDDQGLGCLIMTSASIEAANQPVVKDFLAEVLVHADDVVARRFQRERGVKRGKPSRSDRALARIVTGVMVSLSARARSGESREALQNLVVDTANLVSGGI